MTSAVIIVSNGRNMIAIDKIPYEQSACTCSFQAVEVVEEVVVVVILAVVSIPAFIIGTLHMAFSQIFMLGHIVTTPELASEND